MEMDMESLSIYTSGLTRQFGELVAVDHIDLHIARGKTFGLLGANGAES